MLLVEVLNDVVEGVGSVLGVEVVEDGRLRILLLALAHPPALRSESKTDDTSPLSDKVTSSRHL